MFVPPGIEIFTALDGLLAHPLQFVILNKQLVEEAPLIVDYAHFLGHIGVKAYPTC